MVRPNETFIICFIGPTGTHNFSYADARYTDDGKVDVDYFKQQSPNIHITGVFKSSNELLSYETNEQSEFERVCRNYDFEPQDYRREVIDPVSKKRRLLVGFQPERHKYKIRLYDPKADKIILCTLPYARKYIV